MKKFEDIIQTTIRKNNKQLFDEMKEFIHASNNSASTFDEQLPTSLVLTSSESASSIDTQFQALCDELSCRLHTKNLILDEKKCGSSKTAIEHIIQHLLYAYGISRKNYKDSRISENSGDELRFDIPDFSDSERSASENELDEEKKLDESKVSSNHISTLRNPSLATDLNRDSMDQ